MNLKKIPWYNRPWTKIKKNGISSLDDAELLSVIFSRGNIKENAVEHFSPFDYYDGEDSWSQDGHMR